MLWLRHEWFWETQVRLAFHVSNISENQGASYMWHIDDVRRYDGPTPPLYPDDLSTIPMETSSRLRQTKAGYIQQVTRFIGYELVKSSIFTIGSA